MSFFKTVLLSCWLLGNSILYAQPTYTQYVNPFIGTGGHGHTFPGATLPFGMVQLSPDTRIDGSWDGCSGYHYSDSILYGFSHTHLSGTGVSDYGDILLLPMNNEPALDESTPTALFSHNFENATPGYYAVTLLNDNINAELTATLRTGIHRYTFNKAGLAYIYLDLNHRDKLVASNINIENDSTIKVYRKSEGWAKEQILYANIRFSKPFIQSKQLGNKKAVYQQLMMTLQNEI